MLDEDPRKKDLLRMVTQLKEKIGQDMTEKEFNDFWNAEPGRPRTTPDVRDILDQEVKAGNWSEIQAAKMKADLIAKNPDLVERKVDVEHSAEDLLTMMRTVNPKATMEDIEKLLDKSKPVQETNRGHEDKDREPEATYYFSWVTWAD
jgi:hypothetical protein